ncbi:amino acid permease [Halosquirtibacter xylanolyticus]|uniref:amino acid permease n=1 Tax=Halosquirtibacter xylanolyticus TaxID=3374599 RepID=UPI0037486C3C|nr:amino acid permease [Prolixibacteraceae bacterium]
MTNYRETGGTGKFGTMPVFFTALSTILGAILFLRFGWAVGQLGFVGVMGVIILGHMVTIPTAMSVAEIATNQKVRGGGAYYIISRSFGLNIGAAVGIALYLSQAISIAFYVIALGQAFLPLLSWLSSEFGIVIYDIRMINIPVMVLLSLLMLTKGANVGVKALYGVVVILFASLACFFLGKSQIDPSEVNLVAHVANNKSFFYVFTIVFPAFTGLAAGLGLSGDLKQPEKAIPKGTIWATVVGLVIYIAIAIKFTYSVTPEQMVGSELIMSDIAIWGPIIPIGLAAASMSSALGSIMIAPRTLQAIGADGIFTNKRINSWLSHSRSKDNEPINASYFTIAIAMIFVVVGDVNFVAEIISMFFMITYGTICLISFLEHFAADPAYRPTFRSHWVISLIGTIASFWVMFKMNLPYAALSLLFMGIIYYMITRNKNEKRGFNKLFRGVIFQISRELQVFAQRADRGSREEGWRPFAICISSDTFKRRGAYDFMRWLSYKYGSGTYIHYIKGLLNEETREESQDVLQRLLRLTSVVKSRVYLDTIISPSYTSAIAQVVQLSGISGRGNNLILFEYSRSSIENLQDTLSNYELMVSSGFDICILNSSYKGFGSKREIHIWISPEDYQNANLMILLGYILLGHKDWHKGFIKIFSIASEGKREIERELLVKQIKEGRIPIHPSNVEILTVKEGVSRKEMIRERSIDADLTILGFLSSDLYRGVEKFEGYHDMGNILFVGAHHQKVITTPDNVE